VTLNGVALTSKVFNAVVVDGDFGLLAASGQASFDDVKVKTNDPAFVQAAGSTMMASGSAMAGSASTLTQAQLDTIAASAISHWTDALGDGDPRLASLGSVQLSIADLAGDDLGYSESGLLVIDVDAAGHGWFVDTSTASSSEFRVRIDRNVFEATASSEAFGRMDLLTVVTHELGHVLGFDHDDVSRFAVMDDELESGVRYLLDDSATPAQPNQSTGDDTQLRLSALAVEQQVRKAHTAKASPQFDLDADSPAVGVSSGIDWQVHSTAVWGSNFSPFAASSKTSSNLSDFVLRFPGHEDETSDKDKAVDVAYDDLGHTLRGAALKLPMAAK
jgi:hypothetical protein